jgi:hypothetical protein
MSTTEQRRELSVYEKICAEKCQWCATGDAAQSHSFGDGPLHWVPTKGKVRGGYISCTAPSRDTVIADLAREVNRYERAVEAAPCAPDCESLICNRCRDNAYGNYGCELSHKDCKLYSPMACTCWKAALAAGREED